MALLERVIFQYADSTNEQTRCGNCRHFDTAVNECEFFERLTEEMPDLFNLDRVVSTDAWCSAWQPLKGDNLKAATIRLKLARRN